MLKESENPSIIWPEDKSVRDFNGTWWVAHIKSRNEKALARELAAKGISYFLPMSWQIKRSRGRKVKSLLPIFGGYLFFCGDEKDRISILKTNRVANLIEVNDQQKLVDELYPIELALRAGKGVTSHEYVREGQKCRVRSGSLAGLQGVVVETRGECRLILQVEMLGQAASVDIDVDSIEIE